ncbi:tetratricopeptide repeat protein [Halopseudomonas phragmitis]|uniref:Sel1 repeat family protein n=2 Tax=Pseudomonadaceae TaxID=135621 RepID=A0A1V0B4U1_9GAMM|nr:MULTISPECIES: tetratricopeptide repeat protein [Pseudomonadaceae]AQZ94925.1 hypothetical protein BVH74_09270 [Halopseudomonas phragmitis]RHW23084.1 sel1 repeat family protein [Pseudomonas jilinensis]
MTASIRPLLIPLGFGLLLPALALAESGNPLLISTEERCALNRVDDDSLPLAIEQCTALAKAGDAQAQFEMGELYNSGERLERDVEMALEWYEEASIQGHPTAQYRLGLMHYQGEGVPRNLPQAFIILKMAAVNGEDTAMDASDRIAEEMGPEELAVANQVLSTLFRNYLAQLREEQLNRALVPEPSPALGPETPVTPADPEPLE